MAHDGAPWRNASITKDAIRLAWRNVARANPMHLVGPDSIIHRCASKSSEQCYGEPTFVGLRKLYQRWPAVCAVDGHSVFYDVGSGFGRLSAFMRVHTNASGVHGIEINECRHRSALGLRESVRRELPSAGRLEFLAGDVRAIRLGDATHAFLAAQCWEEELLVDVLSKALAAPRLRCVVVLSRKLPAAWTARVDGLAAAFGRVVAVNEVPTTYRGASAIFFRRGGRCSEEGAAPRGAARASSVAHGRASPLDSPYPAGRRPTCWPMREAVREAERHARLIIT